MLYGDRMFFRISMPVHSVRHRFPLPNLRDVPIQGPPFRFPNQD